MSDLSLHTFVHTRTCVPHTHDLPHTSAPADTHEKNSNSNYIGRWFDFGDYKYQPDIEVGGAGNEAEW